jgi:hypothetical protein
MKTFLKICLILTLIAVLPGSLPSFFHASAEDSWLVWSLVNLSGFSGLALLVGFSAPNMRHGRDNIS